jgi:hypothetical protein
LHHAGCKVQDESAEKSTAGKCSEAKYLQASVSIRGLAETLLLAFNFRAHVSLQQENKSQSQKQKMFSQNATNENSECTEAAEQRSNKTMTDEM